jgi:hypothetical protein
MSTQAKTAGRRPLSEKTKTANPYAGFFSRSLTDIPSHIQKDIEAKGQECRWIDAKDFAEAGNMHKNYWEPYTASKDVAAASHDILGLSVNSEGIVKRRGLVLAVRPKGLGDAHREMIAEKTKRLHRQADVKKTAAEMRKTAREAGIKAEIDDEYDE